MRQITMILLAVVLAPAAVWAGGSGVDSSALDEVRGIPVMDHGRIKPFDTVARETVRAVTGSEYFGVVNDGDYQQVSGEVDPVRMVLDWATNPDWEKRPVLYVANLALRTRLGMKETQEWISPEAVMNDTSYRGWMTDLENKSEAAANSREKMVYASPSEEQLDNAGTDLEEQLRLFSEAADGSLYPVLPSKDKADVWQTLREIEDSSGDPRVVTLQSDWNGVMTAYASADSARMVASAKAFKVELKDQAGAEYANFGRIDREIFYNWFKPFRRAWILYLLAVAVLVAALMIKKRGVYIAAMSVMGAAIAFHIAAFGLRCSITGWAPVSNMYETLIWVSLMTAVFAFVLELVYKSRVIAIGGAVVAMFVDIIGDSVPPNLGAQIKPLEPVLQSQYWLIIHVLCEVSSYAAFALSLVLGNIVLGQFIWGKKNAPSIRTNLLYTYRAVQIGVLLVAAGTILGGLWAAETWGRFWSWDSKEVWALICLLIYVALLHGRFAGWIKQFGMAAGAVLAFTAVVMSWYGVNFMLGMGLHSYGRGTGGQVQVYTGVGIQWAFVVVAWVVYRARYGKAKVAPEDERAGEMGRVGTPVTR